MTVAVIDHPQYDSSGKPWDNYAELVVIGAALLDTETRDQLLDKLTPGDFHNQLHAAMWGEIIKLAFDGNPADPVIFANHIKTIGLSPTFYTTWLNETQAAISSVPTVHNAPLYGERVKRFSVLRQIVTAAERVQQLVRTVGERPADMVLDRAVALFDEIRRTGYVTDEQPTPHAAEILQTKTDHNWVLPGLLEEGDRVIFTGTEGLGKSVLIRQLCVSLAAGIQPFTTNLLDHAAPVLIVDLENGIRQVTRSLRILETATRKIADVNASDWLLWVQIRRGIDLLEPSDRRWLLRRVDEIQPRLLAIGPVYKMHAGDPNDERDIRQVQQILDEITNRGTALILEHHAGHGEWGKARSMRPAGSSLWLRWPEFGYGIALDTDDHAEQERVVTVKPWRGPREERAWPAKLCHGSIWPWEEAQ